MITKNQLIQISKKYIGPMAPKWIEFQCDRSGITLDDNEFSDEKAKNLAAMIGTAAVLLVGKSVADKLRDEIEVNIT